MSTISGIHIAACECQCATLPLYSRVEHVRAKSHRRIQIDRPARVCCPGIHVQCENQMLLRRSTVWRGHGIEEERPRREVNDWRTCDSHRVDIPTGKIHSRHGLPDMSLPQNAAV